MNLPNKLTVLRVIMVPFFVFFMLTGVGGAANKWIALIIFCVASLTDSDSSNTTIASRRNKSWHISNKRRVGQFRFPHY